ncbi:hypothetical protein V5F50_19910 [Xanthobacter sp. V13C-7B]|uniref:hypothetical protein n=1 Tax=Xanthobacter variabilis TaxID=3119932 RepID=UPI00372AE746
MEVELDALERAAGIQTAEERAAFWRQFGHLAPSEMVQAGRQALTQRGGRGAGEAAELDIAAREMPTKRRRPFWLKAILWPVWLLVAMARKMVLLVLIFGLPFVMALNFAALMTGLYGLICAAKYIDGDNIPLWHLAAIIGGSLLCWSIAAGWKWLLNRLLPDDEVIIGPYT